LVHFQKSHFFATLGELWLLPYLAGWNISTQHTFLKLAWSPTFPMIPNMPYMILSKNCLW